MVAEGAGVLLIRGENVVALGEVVSVPFQYQISEERVGCTRHSHSS
jgi:hypothetical protein